MRSERLHQALTSFAKVECGIVAFGMEGDTERAIELVRLRKLMVEQFAIVGSALEADENLSADPQLKRELLRLFSAFRSANALNTAEWPAIRVRDDVERFRRAANSVGLASRAFWHQIEKGLPATTASRRQNPQEPHSV